MLREQMEGVCVSVEDSVSRSAATLAVMREERHNVKAEAHAVLKRYNNANKRVANAVSKHTNLQNLQHKLQRKHQEQQHQQPEQARRLSCVSAIIKTPWGRIHDGFRVYYCRRCGFE